MFLSNSIRGLCMTLACLALAACGGAGGDGGSSYTLSGKVIDGYISGATVCVDLNVNEVCDAGEPTAITTQGGAYKLSYTSSMPQSSTPVLVSIPAGAQDSGGGTHAPSTVLRAYQMRSMADSAGVISPFTTLAYYELKNKPAADGGSVILSQRWAAVANRVLGFTPDLKADHIATGDARLISSAQALNAAIQYQLGTRVPHNGNYPGSMSDYFSNLMSWGYTNAGATKDRLLAVASFQDRPYAQFSTLPVSLAGLSPNGLAIDSKNTIYFASGTKIYRVPNGASLPVVLSNSNSGDVKHLAVNANDEVFFIAGNKISMVIGTTGRIVDVAGQEAFGAQNGAGQVATFSSPSYLFFHTDGILYVADTGNNAIRTVSLTPSGYQVGNLDLNIEGVLTVAKSKSGFMYTSSTTRSLNTYNPDYALISAVEQRIFASNTADLKIPMVSDIGDRTFTLSPTENNIWQEFSNLDRTVVIGRNFAGNNINTDDYGAPIADIFPTAIAINQGGVIYILDAGNSLIKRLD